MRVRHQAAILTSYLEKLVTLALNAGQRCSRIDGKGGHSCDKGVGATADSTHVQEVICYKENRALQGCRRTRHGLRRRNVPTHDLLGGNAADDRPCPLFNHYPILAFA